MTGKNGQGPNRIETGFTNFDGHVVDFGVSSGASSPTATTRAEKLQENNKA